MATAVRSAPGAKVHAPVTVSVELICPPIAPCVIIPGGKSGSVRINGKGYAIAYIARDTGKQLIIDGYRLVSGEADIYDIPADLISCDCPDGCYRVRQGGCKHIVAIRELKATGKIA